MEDFFRLYGKQTHLALEVGHSSIADWCILIYEQPGKEAGKWGSPVISVQECDVKLAFAKAYVALADYCSEHFGGY